MQTSVLRYTISTFLYRTRTNLTKAFLHSFSLPPFLFWNHPDHPIRDFCDTISVKAAADAYIATGLYDAGYRHLHLDDCWAATTRTAAGQIQADPARFPGGMKEVRYLRYYVTTC